jgi:beta-lactamase superfamily II metal-dependent hydrolase
MNEEYIITAHTHDDDAAEIEKLKLKTSIKNMAIYTTYSSRDIYFKEVCQNNVTSTMKKKNII